MVQRYLLQGGLIGPHDEGDWVGYEDYEELERKFNELRARRAHIPNDALDFLVRAEKAEVELQKYKDQFPDYVECANCGSVTHVEGIEPGGKESAWTVWLGGENPVPGRLVDVKFRDGTIAYKDDSCIYRWWFCSGARDSDIIAYRVVE